MEEFSAGHTGACVAGPRCWLHMLPVHVSCPDEQRERRLVLRLIFSVGPAGSACCCCSDKSPVGVTAGFLLALATFPVSGPSVDVSRRDVGSKLLAVILLWAKQKKLLFAGFLQLDVRLNLFFGAAADGRNVAFCSLFFPRTPRRSRV